MEQQKELPFGSSSCPPDIGFIWYPAQSRSQWIALACQAMNSIAHCFLKCSKTCVTTLQYLLQRASFHLFPGQRGPPSTSVFSCRRSHYQHASPVAERFPRTCIVPYLVVLCQYGTEKNQYSFKRYSTNAATTACRKPRHQPIGSHRASNQNASKEGRHQRRTCGKATRLSMFHYIFNDCR